MKKLSLYIIGIFFLQSCSVMIPFKNLPEPDGKFLIGTDVLILEDINRPEIFTEKTNDFRKIVVQVWYPSSEKSDSLYPYLDYPDIRMPYISKRLGVKQRLIEHIKEIQANAYYKSKPIEAEFPVIIFSHGLGGNRTQNTANIESLVSNGYIVFAIEHSYDANITVFNDSTYIAFDSYLSDDANREEFYKVRIPQIKTRADDISFLIDQIEAFKTQGFYIGRLSNIEHIGVFGHSFGGGTAVVSSSLDSRIDACMNLDGWFEPIPRNIINSGINIPFSYIGQEQKNWHGAPYNEELLFDFHKNNKNDSYIMEIKKSNHFDYADIPYLTRFTRLMGLSGKPGKTLTLDLNKTITLFFDSYLKSQNNNWNSIIKNNYNTKISSK